MRCRLAGSACITTRRRRADRATWRVSLTRCSRVSRAGHASVASDEDGASGKADAGSAINRRPTARTCDRRAPPRLVVVRRPRSPAYPPPSLVEGSVTRARMSTSTAPIDGEGAPVTQLEEFRHRTPELASFLGDQPTWRGNDPHLAHSTSEPRWSCRLARDSTASSVVDARSEGPSLPCVPHSAG